MGASLHARLACFIFRFLRRPLLVTGAKFFDTRADKGGGGAIDLAMHLLRLDFVAAVKRLSSSRVSSV
nr:hypothetical protein [Pseudomonas aeruginosa]